MPGREDDNDSHRNENRTACHMGLDEPDVNQEACQDGHREGHEPILLGISFRKLTDEANAGVRAATETRGLVASTNGRIISAMYSSSCGGHSEHLRGIYDGLEPADLTTLESIGRRNGCESLLSP